MYQRFFKKYLMGQSFGRDAIVAYTHITEDKLKQHYQRALEAELAPVVDSHLAAAGRADDNRDGFNRLGTFG